MPDVYKQLTFENIVLTILSILVLAVALWAIYAFIRAIIMFIFSHGEAEKIKKAWSSIRFMILWIFLTVILLFVFPLIFKRMRVPNPEEYSAKNIFVRAGEVVRWLTNMWEWIKEFQTDKQARIPWATQAVPDTEYSL